MYLDKLRAARFRVVKVTAGGMDFWLRELAGSLVIKYRKAEDADRTTLRLIHESLCDPDGNPTENPEDFDAFLAALPASVADALLKAFNQLNRSDEAEIKNS